MRHSPSQTQLESIARDVAVKADYIADRTTTNARLGEILQRLYAPVCDKQTDRFDSVLLPLDQRFSGRGY
jgi:hypothetical protein